MTVGRATRRGSTGVSAHTDSSQVPVREWGSLHASDLNCTEFLHAASVVAS